MQREAGETRQIHHTRGRRGRRQIHPGRHSRQSSGPRRPQGVLHARAGRLADAEEIREALLSGKVWQFGPFAEAVLFSVARPDHVENAIGQALLAGKWVVCDRFLDSTRAYQGATAGVPRR